MKPINLTDDELILPLVRNIYKDKKKMIMGESGELIKETVEVLHKQILTWRSFTRDSICAIDTYINSKGLISNNRCVIYDRNTGSHYVVWQSMQKTREQLYLTKNMKGVGFHNANF